MRCGGDMLKQQADEGGYIYSRRAMVILLRTSLLSRSFLSECYVERFSSSFAPPTLCIDNFKFPPPRYFEHYFVLEPPLRNPRQS